MLASEAGLSQDSLVSVDDAGRGKGLLNKDGERRTIVVKKDGDQIKSFDNPFFSRNQVQKDLNNEVRNLFKETVLKICGVGTLDELPKSVLDVMKAGDYDNKGHPLSVRRIRAVTQAIVAETKKSALADAKQTALELFGSLDVEAEALKLGFTKAELPKLARATRFYAQSAGVDEMTAMREVATYGTKANRLAFYGGRFLESAENFKAGMELLDSFRDWYGDLNRFVHDNNKGKHFADAKTLTHLNVEYKIADKVNAHGQPGLEAMIFQDIAADRKFNLRKRGEDAFGFANNAAMRYFGRNSQNSIFGTVFNVPPAKRRVLFAANDALTPLIKDANTAALFENNKKGRAILGNGIFVSRVLKHIDALEAIIAKKGKLTAKDVFRTCFPDIDAKAMLQARTDERVAQFDNAIAKLKSRGGDPQRIKQYEDAHKAELAVARTAKDDDLYCLATLNYWYDDHLRMRIRNELEKGGLAGGGSAGSATVSILETMVSSGCTVDEVLEAYRKKEPLPIGKYQFGYSMNLDEFPSRGLKQMKLDLTRGTNYSKGGTEENYLKPDEQKFGFTFPDGPAFICSTNADAEEVETKVRSLCGEDHELQAQIVGANLSQDAAVPIKGSLARFNIHNDEHAVLNYSLSKDDDTGAVTIRYSSPDSLPVSFSWTCTVGVDGTSTTTPLELKGSNLFEFRA